MVDFDPGIGGEIQKTRPAVVLSSDISNAVLNRVQVAPISSRVERLYPAEVYVELGGQRRVGTLSPEDMANVTRAVRLQLGL
jgi:mRNA interferase MazF